MDTLNTAYVREGYITWNRDEGRPDICYSDGSCYGGLHCGDTLEAFVFGRWQPTRIEYCHSSRSWYLTGFENYESIFRLTVRN